MNKIPEHILKEIKQAEEELPKYKDVDIYKEFRRRFGNTVLFYAATDTLLNTIGIPRIKEFLKDEHDLLVRKVRKRK